MTAYAERSWLCPALEVRDSPVEGRGLFAREDVESATVLAVMGGVVLGDDDFHRYVSSAARYSAVAVEEGLNLVLEPDTPLQYGNHACDPSMWMSDAVTIVARRAIPAGEEATIDYALHTVDPSWSMECRCGSPRCRGLLTGDDWRRPDLQERYRGHFSPFINRRIERAMSG